MANSIPILAAPVNTIVCLCRLNCTRGVLIGVVSLLAFCGCRPNQRTYDRGNVKLIATLKRGSATYGNVTIGSRQSPFNQNLAQYGDVRLEIAPSNVVRLGELSAAKIKEMSSRSEDIGDSPYNSYWVSGTKLYVVGSRLFFYIKDDDILQVCANSIGLQPGERPPQFGPKESGELYAMPFETSEALTIFGKPDTLNDVWQE
jgi:hypothetical protein